MSGLVDLNGQPLRANAELRAPGAPPLYKGFGNSPREIMKVPPNLSGDAEVRMTRSRAVAKAREAERYYEIVGSSIEKRSLAVVGANLRIVPTPNFRALGLSREWAREFADQCEAAMSLWGDDPRCLCDAEGHHQFGGMMLMAHHNLIGPDGECFVLARYDESRRQRYGSTFATYAEVVDPARLSTPPEAVMREDVRDGRRLDPHGRPIGFYVSRTHPRDGTRSVKGQTWTYVPRETEWGRPIGIHWFRKRRGGVQRGISEIVRSLDKLEWIDTFDKAIIGAATVNALFALYVKSNLDPSTIQQLLTSMSDVENLEDARLQFYENNQIVANGQRVAVLPVGDEIVNAAINRSADSPDLFRRCFQRDVSLSLGVSAQMATNDHSDTNYSSERSAMLNAWRGFLAERYLFGQHVAAPVYGAVIEEAIALGMVELPAGAPDFDRYRAAYLACEVVGPGMGHVDPKKDQEGNEIGLRNSTLSLSEVGSVTGTHWRDRIDRLAEEIAYCEERGIVHPAVRAAAPVQAGADAAGNDDDREDRDA